MANLGVKISTFYADFRFEGKPQEKKLYWAKTFFSTFFPKIFFRSVLSLKIVGFLHPFKPILQEKTFLRINLLRFFVTEIQKLHYIGYTKETHILYLGLRI
jgi:hypothetical protein